MPITIPDQATLQAQCLAFLRGRFPTKDQSTESFLGKTARAWSMMLLGLHESIQNADRDAVPNKNSSAAALDLWASLLGLSNGAGGFGRKGASPSSGGRGNVTGTNGTSFPDGSLLTASDGTTVVKLSGSVAIPGSPPGSGFAAGLFIAVTAGTVGNLDVGSVLTWQSPPAGADQSVTLTQALTNGQDTELDGQLLGRIFDRLQNPPKGGSASDYREWAESITGVDRAYVYPLRGGLGTVHVVITQPGSGSGRKVSGTVQTAVDDFIASVRPVGMQGYQSLLADFTRTLIIRARVVPTLAKYLFEWDDTAGPYLVSSYSAGPPATVTFSAALPASLTSKIDAAKAASTAQTTGPRLQIGSSGGNAFNPQVRAVDYSGSIVTLQTNLPSGFTGPTTGDAIYAGGPVVDQLAKAIRTYIDGLGPSRMSGFADPNDLWSDTASINHMIGIIEGQLDTDGVTQFADVQDGGLTINPGTGPAAVSIQAKDISADGPQILVALHIYVTQ